MATDPDVADVQQAFDDVLSTMGSVRTAAYTRLRALTPLRPYADQLRPLDELDKESTTFEAALRALQETIYADLGLHR